MSTATIEWSCIAGLAIGFCVLYKCCFDDDGDDEDVDAEIGSRELSGGGGAEATKRTNGLEDYPQAEDKGLKEFRYQVTEPIQAPPVLVIPASPPKDGKEDGKSGAAVPVQLCQAGIDSVFSADDQDDEIVQQIVAVYLRDIARLEKVVNPEDEKPYEPDRHCCICRNRIADTGVPCGHMACLCCILKQQVVALERRQKAQCALCRAPYVSYVRVGLDGLKAKK